MLVLSREVNEAICIGRNVVVTVISIIGDKVKLGIEAPGEIPVHRDEVAKAIERAGEHIPNLVPEKITFTIPGQCQSPEHRDLRTIDEEAA